MHRGTGSGSELAGADAGADDGADRQFRPLCFSHRHSHLQYQPPPPLTSQRLVFQTNKQNKGLVAHFDDIITMPKKSLPASTTNSRCASIRGIIVATFVLASYSLTIVPIFIVTIRVLITLQRERPRPFHGHHTSSAVDICARFLRLMSTLKICFGIHRVFLYYVQYVFQHHVHCG